MYKTNINNVAPTRVYINNQDKQLELYERMPMKYERIVRGRNKFKTMVSLVLKFKTSDSE